MRLEDLNWMDVESYLQHEDRLMLVLGACEQHGYLSLTTDVRIPLALADAASERTGVLVAPPVPFGLSTYFSSYPGTISLRTQTYLLLIEDILRELQRQGFRKVLVLNGHGGNFPAMAVLEELMTSLPGLRLGWYSWFEASRVQAAAEKHGLRLDHANWSEAFSFTQVAPLPPGEKAPIDLKIRLEPGALRRVLGDGVFSGKYQATPEAMDALFSAALEDVIAELEQLVEPAPD
jgi:creatinine amidohydrolase